MDQELKREVLELEHNSKVVVYITQDKTLKIAYRNFVCPKIEAEINDYIRSYLV
jgi:hypothetical protein